jgi:hypothetical protein
MISGVAVAGDVRTRVRSASLGIPCMARLSRTAKSVLTFGAVFIRRTSFA